MRHSTQRPIDSIWLVLALFLSARVMMVLTWPVEDLTRYGDYDVLFRLAAFSQAGNLPFIHYWSEYPPLFPWLNVLIYQVSGDSFKNYALLLSLALLAFEAGALLLLYRLAVDLHGRERALQVSWIYATLGIPVFIWLGTFEAMTSCFLLAALWALSRAHAGRSGLLIGLGALTKLVPLVVLPVVWRGRGWRATLASGAVVVLVCLACLAPLYVLGPDFTLASLQAQLAKSSSQTIWAIIDGNLANTGNFGPLVQRFSPAAAGVPLHNPSRLPAWLTALPFAALGIFLMTRPIQRVGQHVPILTALLIVLFFLWSKGWSPQWQLFLIPLLLLALAPGRAVMFILVLGFVNLLEWPVILSRGLTHLLPLTIVVRTLILALLGWELYRELIAAPQSLAAVPPGDEPTDNWVVASN
jgi:hypothetical protein